jgi:uncharacterized protein (TIGR02646 family)
MRPVDRGGAPQVFSDYADAKPFLVSRLGDYCSYCERPIKTNLAVEHVLPKSRHPNLELDWANFLLGCVNCNSTKGRKPVDRTKCLLPDQDNTSLAYHYKQSGQVVSRSALADEIREKAEALLALTGLNKFPTTFPDGVQFEAALERWQQRSLAWSTAEMSLQAFESEDTVHVADLIVTLARSTGFFSVWLRVFGDHPAMRVRFIEAFPGTASDCFDSSGQAVNRPGGQI